MEVAGMNAANENFSPPIFKLDVDCCDEIFDYLSLFELHTLAQTCKAMQKVTGIYFRRNFTKFHGCVKPGGGLQIFIWDRGRFFGFPLFKPFTPCVKIRKKNFNNHLDFIQFKSAKEITFESIIFHPKLCGLASILSEIEVLKLVLCHFESGGIEIFEEYLNLCVNLRTLEIRYYPAVILKEDNNEWLKRKYPLLQKIVLCTFRKFKIKELRGFLELNPNIRWLGMDCDSFLASGEELLESNVKLDDLMINFIKDDLQALCNLLRSLYDRRFYKRVHIDMRMIRPNDVNFLASISGFGSLLPLELDGKCNFSRLQNLKCLHLDNSIKPSYDMFPLRSNYLINLEYIYLFVRSCENFSFMVKCVCEMPNLKTMEAMAVSPKPHEYKINVYELNEKRQKLANPQKLIIYIPEYWFLETKWSTKNGDMNLSHIEMKRGGDLLHSDTYLDKTFS